MGGPSPEPVRDRALGRVNLGRERRRRPPVDLERLVPRTGMVTTTVARSPRTLVLYWGLVVATVALVVLGIVLGPTLVELGRDIRGRYPPLVLPFFAALLTALSASLFAERALRGEYRFTYGPTGEPMREHLVFRMRADVAYAARLHAMFRSHDPARYAPLPLALGAVRGRILVAPIAGAAIVTLGVAGRPPTTFEPVLLVGDAYRRLMAVPVAQLRAGKPPIDWRRWWRRLLRPFNRPPHRGDR